MNKNENGFEGQYVTSPTNQAQGNWGRGAPMSGPPLAREFSGEDGQLFVFLAELTKLIL